MTLFRKTKKGKSGDELEKEVRSVAETASKEKSVDMAKAGAKGKKKVKTSKKKKGKIKKKGLKERLLLRVILAALVNIVVFIILFVILGRMPEKAKELKNLKNSIMLAEQSVDVNIANLEIASNKETADKLLALYPDDVGLVDFVQEIEKLKNDGTVTNFSFANQKPVRDNTKYSGIPVAIELIGTWEEIGKDFEKLQKIPFLLRPVSVQVGKTGEEGKIIIKYGGFLYVDESLEEN